VHALTDRPPAATRQLQLDVIFPALAKRPLARALVSRLLGVPRLQGILDAMGPSAHPGDFCARALDALGVSLDVTALGSLPAQGPLVVLANHPTGLLDGLVLGAVLHQRRDDVRILGNRLLTAVPELTDEVIPVDPFARATSTEANVGGMRDAFRWVARGGALVIFPAGEVAHRRAPFQPVEESPWHPALARLVRRTRAAVVPVHVAAENSRLFHWLGYAHPLLRTARLPRELPTRRQQRLSVTVGAPLDSVATLPDDDTSAMEALRLRCLALGASARRVPSRTPVADPEPLLALEAELALLPPSALLDRSGSYDVYTARAVHIPALLREIARLREVTFRDAGEGTGAARDLDDFDAWYEHLFVWDRVKREVVGAYRLGRIDEILAARGQDGLYTQTLFDIDPRFFARLGPSLELGRSFIRREHQRNYGALNVLWRGIGRWVARHPQYRHLLGAVSISDRFTTPVQWLLVRFLQHNHLDHELASLVRPRNAVLVPETPSVLERGATCLDTVSSRVRSAEPDGQDLPVLLRQYLRLGGRIVGANRDTAFGNAIDELVVVDLLAAPAPLVRRYLGDDGVAALRAHHAAPTNAAP
jgi:putative hemolysin